LLDFAELLIPSTINHHLAFASKLVTE